MTATSLDTVHMAAYDALIARVSLTTLLGGSHIFDTVAPSGLSRYIVLGQPTETAFDALNAQFGNENTLMLHLWSRDAATSGNATIAAMYAEIKAALHHVRLTLSTGSVIHGRTEFITSLLDPDLVSMHGIARYQSQGRV